MILELLPFIHKTHLERTAFSVRSFLWAEKTVTGTSLPSLFSLFYGSALTVCLQIHHMGIHSVLRSFDTGHPMRPA